MVEKYNKVLPSRKEDKLAVEDQATNGKIDTSSLITLVTNANAVITVNPVDYLYYVNL